jgi:hypothetical protein
MPEQADPVSERVRSTPGLGPIVAQAEAVWRERADGEPDADAAGWNQVFPSQFQEFTNRPR